MQVGSLSITFLIVACGGEAPRVLVPPTPPVAVPPRAPSPSCTEDTGGDGVPPRGTRAAVPTLDLGGLVVHAPSKPSPIRGTVDLGRVALRLPDCVRPEAAVDVSTLALPASVPREGLPDDAKATWDKMFASDAELRGVWVRTARLEERRETCAQKACAREVCLQHLVEEAKSRATALRREQSELETILAQKLTEGAKVRPTSGTRLALGYLEERVARRDVVDEGELLRRMAPAIAHYEASKALGDATTPTGWFARYFLARAYVDEKPDRAREELRSLLAVPHRSGTADVALRLADLETDPSKAVQAYKTAVQFAGASDADLPIREVATLGLFRAEMALGHFASASSAAGELLELGRVEDERSDLVREAELGLARALDAGAGVGAPGAESRLPRVPAESFARIGLLLAREALSRFEPTAPRRGARSP